MNREDGHVTKVSCSYESACPTQRDAHGSMPDESLTRAVTALRSCWIMTAQTRRSVGLSGLELSVVGLC